MGSVAGNGRLFLHSNKNCRERKNHESWKRMSRERRTMIHSRKCESTKTSL